MFYVWPFLRNEIDEVSATRINFFQVVLKAVRITQQNQSKQNVYISRKNKLPIFHFLVHLFALQTSFSRVLIKFIIDDLFEYMDMIGTLEIHFSMKQLFFLTQIIFVWSTHDSSLFDFHGYALIHICFQCTTLTNPLKNI